MNICVCGWYGREFDDFYMTLYKANKRHPVTVIAKRDDPYWNEMALSYDLMDNVGLEFGAYSYYLNNIWGGGDTLYTHDDVCLMPIIRDHKTVPMESIFDKLADMPFDQAYLFENRAEDVVNHGKHGRAIFMSDKMQTYLKKTGGIWFDENNQGITEFSEERYFYNAGIAKFDEQMAEAKKLGYKTQVKVYAPAYRTAHRGKIKNWEDLL